MWILSEDSKYFIQNQYFEQQIKSKDNIYLKPFLKNVLKSGHVKI